VVLPPVDSVPYRDRWNPAIKDVAMNAVLVILEIAVLLAVAFGYGQQ
jgi:hypothetical protein